MKDWTDIISFKHEFYEKRFITNHAIIILTKCFKKLETFRFNPKNFIGILRKTCYSKLALENIIGLQPQLQKQFLSSFQNMKDFLNSPYGVDLLTLQESDIWK